MVNVLHFIRWKNLAIIGIIVFCLKYFVFHTIISNSFLSQFTSTFSLIQTTLLTLSIMIVAAGGYIINDINDIDSDRINKKDKTLILDQLSEEKAQLLYFILTITGISIGLYLSLQIGLYQLVFFHVISAALLWMYSTYFKSSVLIGNVIVSLLSALVPFCYFCFESFSYLQNYSAIFQSSFGPSFQSDALEGLWWFTIVLAIFAFAFTLIREIIKDVEDLEGDNVLEGKTLPQSIGSQNTLWVIRALLFITVTSLMALYYTQLQTAPFNSIAFHMYLYITVVFPSVFMIWESFKNQPDYTKLSTIVKIIMIFGILSCYLYSTLY